MKMCPVCLKVELISKTINGVVIYCCPRCDVEIPESKWCRDILVASNPFFY